MTLFSSILFFILGAAVGSFLNVVAYRSIHGGSVLFGSSRCPHCKHKLAAKDLVPIVSFLALSGKCRYCGKSISLQYPIVEAAAGVLFALTFYYWSGLVSFQFPVTSDQYLFSSNWLLAASNLIYLLFVVSVLIVLFVTDVRDGLLPNSVVLPAVTIVATYKLLLVVVGSSQFSTLIADLLTALVVSGIFFAIVALSGEKAMGGGDVKLAFLIGLAVGWPATSVALFTSFLTGAIVAVMLILIGKKRFGESVPFGPFLSLGAVIALFWGREIIDLYLRVLS